MIFLVFRKNHTVSQTILYGVRIAFIHGHSRGFVDWRGGVEDLSVEISHWLGVISRRPKDNVRLGQYDQPTFL